jgi:hypothetical protein
MRTIAFRRGIRGVRYSFRQVEERSRLIAILTTIARKAKKKRELLGKRLEEEKAEERSDFSHFTLHNSLFSIPVFSVKA